jgi:hypothetical protein
MTMIAIFTLAAAAALASPAMAADAAPETAAAEVMVDPAPLPAAPVIQNTGEPSRFSPPPANTAAAKVAAADTPVDSAGKLKLGGAVRGRYDLRFNDANGAGQRKTSSHLSFDTVILSADYDSSKFFASAQYRFYGGSFLYGKASGYQNYPGEISFPVYAYAGVKLDAKNKVAFGLQAVPFDDQFFGSSFLNSLGFVYGMEETYNVGATFAHSGKRLSFAGGFFPAPAPAAFGISADSSRYSVNIVKGDIGLANGSSNAERNMAIGNVHYKLVSTPNSSLTVAASAWISQIHNFDTRQDGARHSFALSLKATQGPWHAAARVARQDIWARNPGNREVVSVGDYDGAYNIAAHGTLVFGEVGRSIDTGKLPVKLDLYANYARFLKDAAGFKDTTRVNVGAYWTDKAHQRIRVWTEALIGQNDPNIGAGQFSQGAAMGGDNRTKVSFLCIFGYYF